MALELMRGNEAVAEGAIRAGCRFYTGYPITPQNELFEYMAKRMPQAGGIFLQSESEVAGINMIWGAACTGTRAMTSSSGPGISLMSEGLTTLAAGQLPCVIVDVTRAGPGLGRIAPAQSDYRQVTKGGGHGDYHVIVLGPASTQEMAELANLAFYLADVYRNPVIILMDGMLGQMMEPVDFDLVKPLPAPEKPWALRGKGEGARKMIYAAPFDDPGLIQLNLDLEEKYGRIQENEQRWEEVLVDGAELVVVAFGSVGPGRFGRGPHGAGRGDESGPRPPDHPLALPQESLCPPSRFSEGLPGRGDERRPDAGGPRAGGRTRFPHSSPRTGRRQDHLPRRGLRRN